VTAHPKVFATFTAPSFGPVHHRVVDNQGKIKRCHPHGPTRCRQRHRVDDPQLGQPLDPATYDYTAAVIWNALATRLWARTVQLANRKAAQLLRIPQRDWPNTGRVSVAKVAEYQARGVVHFHAIFRLDGPTPADPPPARATVDLLSEAIRHAAGTAHINPPASSALTAVAPATWGDQIDLRPITGRETGNELADAQVAAYVAKYATKGADASGTVDRPLTCRNCKGVGQVETDERFRACEQCGGTGVRGVISTLPIAEHVKMMILTCWDLGGRTELKHLRLRPWAHMLAFRGHFATKSRRYSTTLGCLRGVRRSWRIARSLKAHGIDPAARVSRRSVHELDDLEVDPDSQDTVLVIGSWLYTGRGHSPGQAVFAASVREELADSRWLSRRAAWEESQIWEGAA
jgi:hypothetical protein